LEVSPRATKGGGYPGAKKLPLAKQSEIGLAALRKKGGWAGILPGKGRGGRKENEIPKGVTFRGESKGAGSSARGRGGRTDQRKKTWNSKKGGAKSPERNNKEVSVPLRGRVTFGGGGGGR